MSFCGIIQYSVSSYSLISGVLVTIQMSFLSVIWSSDHDLGI